MMNDDQVKKIAEKWLPYKPFQMRDDRYDPVDLNLEPRKACESAIREALQGAVEAALREMAEWQREQDAKIAEGTPVCELREIGRGELRKLSGKRVRENIAAAIREGGPK